MAVTLPTCAAHAHTFTRTCTYSQFANSHYNATLKSLSIVSNVFECSGNCALMSSEPIKMLSRWDHVL